MVRVRRKGREPLATSKPVLPLARGDLPGVPHEHRVVTVAEPPEAITRIGDPPLSLRAKRGAAERSAAVPRLGDPPLSLRALRREASQGVAISRIAAGRLQCPMELPGPIYDMVR